MIDTKGMNTVAEAAKRINRSIEQVRRKLREGKLKGQRVNNQWFVDGTEIRGKEREAQPLIPREVMADVRRVAQRIAERNPGYVFDPVDMVRRAREDH